MKKYILFTCIFSMFSPLLYSQLSTGETPISWTLMTQETSIPQITLPSLNFSQLAEEDSIDEQNGVPPRFGHLQAVNINLTNSGKWETLDNGDRIWKVRIYSPDALSINLLYDQYWVPAGAKLFIYPADKTEFIGAFTETNNKTQASEGFATGLIYSNNIIMEYYEPATVVNQGIISVEYVVSGYKYIQLPNQNNSQQEFNISGDCQVNINCPEGNNWQNEKDAVALILVNGNRYCTGSLINTTENDYTPYLLTANHCLEGWANNNITYDAINRPNLPHYSFYWKYETPSCPRSNVEPARLSTSGAKVIANNSSSDFALLKLTEDPKNIPGFSPYYLGWDSRNMISAGGVGIHHPAGDTKKIATYTQTPVSSGNFWKLYWIQTPNGHSVTEGGSSGSPLINSEHRIIGQLYGGSTKNCSNPSQDYALYGKLSVSWTSNNTSEPRRKLNTWLDPDNTSGGIQNSIRYVSDLYLNNMIINSDRTFEGGDIYVENVQIQSGANVTFRGTRSVTLKNGFTAVTGSTVDILTGFPPLYNSPQLISSQYAPLEIESVENPDNKTCILYQNIPNPFSNITTIRYYIPENVSNSFIVVYNSIGIVIKRFRLTTGESEIYIQASDFKSGLYTYSLISNGQLIDSKRMVIY